MKQGIAAVVTAMIVLLPAAAVSPGQSLEELAAEVAALKRGQEALQQDVSRILEILERTRPQAPKAFEPVGISLDGVPFKGDPGAKVTIVEFTDYECPFCARHHNQTLPHLLRDYIESGKVRYYLREFPLKSLHPHAEKAAEAALCALDQRSYWQMHDTLFANQKNLSELALLEYAREQGLEVDEFGSCLRSGKHAARVDEDLQTGAAAGVTGTPSFFLGRTDTTDKSKFRATVFLQGAQPYALFKNSIEELLADGN
jgi:protein-disulfide isomerase